MMLVPCSNNGLLFSITSAVYFVIVLPTIRTKECGLQLKENIKRRYVVFSNVDKKLCRTECIEEAFIIASCRRSGYEPKKIEKVPSKFCGSKVCNETSQCLDAGCIKVCVEAPSLCDLHSASKTGNLSKVKYALSQARVDINCQEWIGRTPVIWAASGGHKEVVDLLVREGANLTLVDSSGINILHSACLGGNVELVKCVLSQNVLDINGRVTCGRTAVMLAAENGHKGVVELLVDKGADVSLVDETHDNILHCACRGGDVEVVKYILSQKMVNIHSKGSNGRTPVMLAGRDGHKEVVELLVKHGAKLSLRDIYGYNILHVASGRGHVDVVEHVISQHTVDINSKGYKQRTPVMSAAVTGHTEVVELLVKNGANLALKDVDGHNILHCTSAGGHLEVIKYIVSLCTVDINSRGPGFRTSVMLAGYNGHKQVVEFLVNHGAELSLVDVDTNNILHLTSKGGSLEVMEYLLSQNASDINCRGRQKRTPVMYAAEKGHKKMVEFLVEHGANLSLRTRRGSNVLHLACQKGQIDVVKYLLSQNSVDINSRGWKKKTPAMIAAGRGHKGLVELLQNHGAQLTHRSTSQN